MHPLQEESHFALIWNAESGSVLVGPGTVGSQRAGERQVRSAKLLKLAEACASRTHDDIRDAARRF